MKSLFENSTYLQTIDTELLDWYEISEVECFPQSLQLWDIYVLLGGAYDPEIEEAASLINVSPGDDFRNC
jgi:hypothetical protein